MRDNTVSQSMRRTKTAKIRRPRAQRTLKSSKDLFFLNPDNTIPGCTMGNAEGSEKPSTPSQLSCHSFLLERGVCWEGP